MSTQARTNAPPVTPPAVAPAQQPQQQDDVAPLEVDSRITDSDSSYGDEISTYTASLTSSVNSFVEEYGRIYSSFSRTDLASQLVLLISCDSIGDMLPVDEQENERLDIHHALMLVLLDGKLHLAPIGGHPQRCLDIGTGTGCWAIDFADQYPSAEVIANDLAPIQPTSVPPNLKFIIDDFEAPWAYEREPFDYVHSRYLASSVNNWPKLVQQAYANIKPGGWVEFQDWDTYMYSADNSVPKEQMLQKFHEFTCTRRTEAGYDTQPGHKLEGWVRDAGFINIQAHHFTIPLGTWPKDKKYKQVGAYNLLQFSQGLEGIAIGCLTEISSGENPWNMTEVQALVAETRRDLKNGNLHGQYNFFVVCGQKPEDHDETAGD